MNLYNGFRYRGKFLLLIMVIIVLSGCGKHVIGNPVPGDFLNKDSADIFLLEGTVFSNVEEVDWIKELDYTIGKEVGEITKKTDKVKEFRDGSSNILPVGTKIYDTDTEVYIAIVDGEEIPYLKMLEG